MARMLGKSSQRPFIYGLKTGRMKKCFGCWDGCGYEASNQVQRRREAAEWRQELVDTSDPWVLDDLGYARAQRIDYCPVCGDRECRGNGPLEDKWYIGCYA